MLKETLGDGYMIRELPKVRAYGMPEQTESCTDAQEEVPEEMPEPSLSLDPERDPAVKKLVDKLFGDSDEIPPKKKRGRRKKN